jgi:3-oxoadipate enol-lactonase
MSRLEIESGGRKLALHYRLEGREGAPVLAFSNSLGTTLAMWQPQMEALAGRFRILRYDSRGHGSSDVPEGPYTIEQLGRDFLALLDGLGLGAVHFCGVSMGGMVGMWLGIHAPERLNRLVVANSSARIGNAEAWNQRIRTVREEGMAAIAPGVIERWFTPGFRERAPEAVAPVWDQLLACPPEGYAAACAAVRDQDQLDSVHLIRAETLVIAGRQDEATPIEHANAIVERSCCDQFVELDAAHLSNIEQADAFNRALNDFL